MAAIMIIIICGIAFFAAIGALVGAFRRFTNMSKYGLSVLLTFCVLLIVSQCVAKDNANYAYVSLGVSLGACIVFMLLLSFISKTIKKARESKRAYKLLEAKDELDETEALMQSAVDNKDKGEYKRLKKQHKKLSRVGTGVGGVFDVILGALSGFANVVVALFAVVFSLIMVGEFAVGVLPSFGLESLMGNILNNGIWLLGKKYLLDIVVLILLFGCIRLGYTTGISSLLCVIILFALTALAGYAAYAVAGTEMCASAVSSISNGLLASIPAAFEAYKSLIARVIISAGIFIALEIVVIIIGIFLPRIFVAMRKGKTFMTVDGALGAVVIVAVIFALLLVGGGLLYEFVKSPSLSAYFENSTLSDSFFSANPLNNIIADFIETVRTASFLQG